MSWKLQNLASGAGWAKLGLLILAGLTVANAGRAQTSFYSPGPLGQTEWGTVTNNNTAVTPDPGAPNIAGFAPFAPLWYQWQAPQDGVVELDTVGSVTTASSLVGYDTNSNAIYVTNVVNLDTV